MLLGIEIGGTKIQLAVGEGDGSPLVEVDRFTVAPGGGASGILDELALRAPRLFKRHAVSAIGIGFGGPVDAGLGRAIKSHHVTGWLDFPLVQWCDDRFSLPAAIGNDADVAGLAEARFGAGQGRNPVFYITIGTGIGGGLIVDDRIYNGAGYAAAEIGHFRPSPEAADPSDIVEARSAGWGIAAQTRQLCRQVEHGKCADEIADLIERCDGQLDDLTTKTIGEAAAAGNRLALQVFDEAWKTLGWAIAQVINLVSPRAIIIGGGVSLLGEQLCLTPLRQRIASFVFPPLAATYEVKPAALGEEVVLHGALAIAADLRT